MIEVKFPIKYYEGNTIFNYYDEAWSYFEVKGFEYDYLSFQDKNRLFHKLESFFANINVQTHLLVLPKYTSVKDTHEQFKRKIVGPVKEAAIKHTEEASREVEKLVGSEATDFHFYIGLKHSKPEAESINFSSFKNDLANWLNKTLSSVKAENPDITKVDYERVLNESKQLRRQLSGLLKNIEPIDEEEIQFLIRRNFYRGIGRPPIMKGYTPSYDQTPKGFKPRPHDLIKLTEGIIDTKSLKRRIVLNQNVDGAERSGYCAFLTVSYVPNDMWNIGDEWLYIIQNLPFPVELSIRTETIEYRNVLNIVNKKKKDFDDQKHHAAQAEAEAPAGVEENILRVRELEAATNASKMPLIKSSTVICVYASDLNELNGRIRAVKDLYLDLKIHIEQPASDQFQLFNEFLPGAKQYVTDYVQYMEPGTMAASMYGATKNIGDGEGFFIALHGVLNRPVYINIWDHAQGKAGSKTRSPSMIFIGPPGGGKSFTANLITYHAVLAGARALIVDPKGERSNWPDDLKDLAGFINVITLTADDENKGRLDPFAITENIKDAQALAVDIVTFLTGVKTQDVKFADITNAIGRVAETAAPCMDEVVRILIEDKNENTAKIGYHLKAFQNLSFASLLFGDGETPNPIKLENPMNILQIQNLKMPPKNKAIEKYNPSEMLSMAMMLSIGAFAHEFIKLDNKLMKIVFLDESWFIEKTDIGVDIVQRLIREGRYMNAGVFRSTQAPNDGEKENEAMIGMKFIFQSNNVSEIKKSLELLGLEDDLENIETVQNLEVGQCLMQDIYGRTSVVSINPLFKDIHDAFDTRPKKEQEQEEKAIHLEKFKEVVHV